MSTEKEMSTKYDPTAVEAGRYQWWIDQGLFKPSGRTSPRMPRRS